MKCYENESQNNIIDSLIEDKISRNKALINFLKVISKIENNQVIAINGGWGSGKSFFVKQLDLLINFINNIDQTGKYINPELETNKLPCLNSLNTQGKINLNSFIDINRIRNLFEGNQTNCIYFNAWEYDNSTEPILSIIYKIVNDMPNVSSDYIEENEGLFEKMLNSISSYFTNGEIKIVENVTNRDLAEVIITSEELKDQINNFFKEILVENCNRLIIIIDELDRCKPTYALKLLEELKHFITSDKITVILSTNIYQLSNTIRNIYGYGFDVCEYLDKIIDLSISLKPIDKYKYIQSLNLESFNRSSNWFSDVIMAYVNYKKINMRSINRYIKLMSLFESHIFTSERRPRNIRILLEYIFLPYCIGEQIFTTDNYESFTKGDGFEEFYKYFLSNEIFKIIMDECIYQSINITDRRYKEDLNKIYNNIYNNENRFYSERIGNEYIDTSDKEYFYELSSVLNEFIEIS